MTIDIERERREFSEHFKRGPAAAYMGWVEINKRFRDPAVQENFETWLAAKRAAQGSAEPVATVVNNWRDDDGNLVKGRVVTLGDFDLEHVPHGTKLYTAPPAPVSAEPVTHASAEDYLRGKYGAYRGHHAWRELEEAFNAGAALAPPSTDAKDSGEKISSDELWKLLPSGNDYLDEPDGGSPTLLVQLQRMSEDADNYRWLKARNGGSIGIVAWHRDEEKEMVLVEQFADEAISAARAAIAAKEAGK